MNNSMDQLGYIPDHDASKTVYHAKEADVSDHSLKEDESLSKEEYSSDKGYKNLVGFQPLTFIDHDRESSSLSVKVLSHVTESEEKEDTEMRNPTPVADELTKDGIKVN